MPNRCATRAACLRNARGLVLNLIGSLDFCIAQSADEGVMAQQGPFIIGELEHALAQVREAQAKVFPEVVEKRRRAA